MITKPTTKPWKCISAHDPRTRFLPLMKIFQIGFNELGSDAIHNFMMAQGFRSVHWDDGRLATRMMDNFQNCEPLLKGYEDYDCFLDMENVEKNVFANLIFFEMLDKQYPGSKFILNTGEMNTWLQMRESNTTYLERYMKATNISSVQEVLKRWKRAWTRHHTQVLSYFGKRLHKDLLVLHMDNDEPVKLFLFLSNPNVVRSRFLELYTHALGRFTYKTLNPILPDIAFHFLHTSVYCIYLEERRQYAETTFQKFGLNEVVFFRGLREMDDLQENDYKMLSTTHINTTIYPRCKVCTSASLHKTIYEMPTKLRVHLSYMFCLQHAMQTQTYASYVLVFEDDVYFRTTLQEMHETISEFIERDFDVLYLGFCYCRDGNKLEPVTPTSNLVLLPPNQSLKCKHAILYKKSYLEDLLPHLLPLTHNSDIMFNHANIFLKGKVCIPRRALVFQDRDRFDSQNGNPRASTESDGYLYR